MAKCRISWFRTEKSCHIAMKNIQGYSIHVACETIKCLLCSSLLVLSFNEYLFPFCGNHAITHCDTLTHILSCSALFRVLTKYCSCHTISLGG